jgi:hypothetical protein
VLAAAAKMRKNLPMTLFSFCTHLQKVVNTIKKNIPVARDTDTSPASVVVVVDAELLLPGWW